MEKRTLGRSGIEVSALGLGCWAIGGPFWRNGVACGWGEVDDQDSLRAIQYALDQGITFFDTADVYGAGHSERILGQALAGHRGTVVVATKFGNVFEEATRQVTGRDVSPNYIKAACEASLARLNTDYIDLYQLHPKEAELETAAQILTVLEELVSAGKIRYYGWSTDNPARARFFAQGEHCTAIQHNLNIFEDNPAMLAVCEEENLASINRGPLARGVLTGKFSPASTFSKDDVRYRWNFKEGEQAARLEQLQLLKDILVRDGRTLTQGALGWIWGKSSHTIPITGFKSVAQVEENVGAMKFGKLRAAQMEEIARRMGVH